MKWTYALLIGLSSMLPWAPDGHAATYTISQSRDFLFEDPKTSLSRWSYDGSLPDFIYETDHIDLGFYGAPRGFVLAGKPRRLSLVNIDVSYRLYYEVDATAFDDGFFVDALTKGAYQSITSWEPGPFPLPPSEPKLLTLDGQYFDLHDESTGTYAAAHFRETIDKSGTRAYAFGPDHPDPAYRADVGFVDLDDFAIRLTRNLNVSLHDFDSNDDENWVAINNYRWEGSVDVAYEYDVIPLPPALWLLGSGLVGLVILSRGRGA